MGGCACLFFKCCFAFFWRTTFFILAGGSQVNMNGAWWNMPPWNVTRLLPRRSGCTCRDFTRPSRLWRKLAQRNWCEWRNVHVGFDFGLKKAQSKANRATGIFMDFLDRDAESQKAYHRRVRSRQWAFKIKPKAKCLTPSNSSARKKKVRAVIFNCLCDEKNMVEHEASCQQPPTSSKRKPAKPLQANNKAVTIKHFFTRSFPKVLIDLM